MTWFKDSKADENYDEETKAIRLSEMKPNESAVVESVGGTGAIRRRIIDMGITPGVKIEVIKLAPLGDPMEIRLRGYQLSIRKSDAGEIYLLKKSGRKDE